MIRLPYPVYPGRGVSNFTYSFPSFSMTFLSTQPLGRLDTVSLNYLVLVIVNWSVSGPVAWPTLG